MNHRHPSSDSSNIRGMQPTNSMVPLHGMGRGRGATLPAWATQQQGVSSLPAALPSLPTFFQPSQNSSSLTLPPPMISFSPPALAALAAPAAPPPLPPPPLRQPRASQPPATNHSTLVTPVVTPTLSQHPAAPWTCTTTLEGHVGPVLTLSLNESGSHLLSGGHDRTVRLWNPRRGTSSSSSSTASSSTASTTKHAASLLATFDDGRITHAVAGLAILPGSKQFVTCGGTTRALLWDLNTKQLVRKFNGHSLRVNCVAQGGHGGSVLFTGGYDRLVVAHDLRSRTEIQTLPKCTDSVESIAVVHQDILAADANGCLHTYDLRKGTIRKDMYHAPIGHASIAPGNGKCVALSCQDGRVRLVERSTGLLLCTFTGGHITTDFKIGCTFVDDGRIVVTGSEDGRVVMYDTMTEKILGVLDGSSTSAGHALLPPERVAVCALGTSRDYGFLVSGSYDGSIKVWHKK